MYAQVAVGEAGFVEGGEAAPEEGVGVEGEYVHVLLQCARDGQTLLGDLVQQTLQQVAEDLLVFGESVQRGVYLVL